MISSIQTCAKFLDMPVAGVLWGNGGATVGRRRRCGKMKSRWMHRGVFLLGESVALSFNSSTEAGHFTREIILTEQRIEPHKVTKPIQLLAAWLVGLVLTNASFLVAATHSSLGGWERGALVVAAIVNVPIFLLALFLLQTRFRAELQEDTFYADYLSKKTSTVIRIDKNAAQDEKIEELERSLASISIGVDGGYSDSLRPTICQPVDELDWTDWPVALNHLHPRFSEVRESLRAAKIPLASIFGDTGDAPSHWVISMSYSLPVAHKTHLLRVLLPFGFDGIQFWRPNRDADEDEDVYIGSYGNDGFAKVTEDLSRLLDTAVEAADLNHYYEQHKIRLPKPRKEV